MIDDKDGEGGGLERANKIWLIIWMIPYVYINITNFIWFKLSCPNENPAYILHSALQCEWGRKHDHIQYEANQAWGIARMWT